MNPPILGLEAQDFLIRFLPRGSYPILFLGYLALWLGSVILKSRHPKKGVGYEPLGTVGFEAKILPTLRDLLCMQAKIASIARGFRV